MKYWRGFLTAGIIGACAAGLTAFAKTHPTLVDMIFPYISRMISGSMAQWSAGVSFCLWQVFLVLCVLVVCTLLVLAIVLRWNVLQVTGWIAAAASIIVLLQFGVLVSTVMPALLQTTFRWKYPITTLRNWRKRQSIS